MYQYILDQLPYKAGFRFVDSIEKLNEDGSTGYYTLRPDAFYYEDHFPGYPVTPGVIITEIMAQIGLVVLGIFLVNSGTISLDKDDTIFPLLSNADVSFNKMVLPGERVKVVSRKKYFRFHKLKAEITMFNEKNELVASGIFSGIIKAFTKPSII